MTTTGIDKRPIILIVEDQRDDCETLKNSLGNEEYELRVAVNSEQALRTSRASSPDLIILDIALGTSSENGFEICKKMKKMDNLTSVPIIFSSIDEDSKSIEEAFEAGAVDYVAKPIIGRALKQRVETHLRLSRTIAKLEKAEKTKSEFHQKFVPEEATKLLLGDKSDSHLEYGMSIEKEMTVLFSDIRNFTTISEKMTAEESFLFLNNYLAVVGPIITKNDGFIDKFIGDGIMAIFPERPETAVHAAVEMQTALGLKNKEEKNNKLFWGVPTLDGVEIRTGIGIHTGKMRFGVVGEKNRLQPTAISDAVNLAARLESATKTYKAEILISDDTRKRIEHSDPGPLFDMRCVGFVKVKGKGTPVQIHEVLDSLEPLIKQGRVQSISEFEKGMEKYRAREFGEACKIFFDIARKNQTDGAASMNLRVCSELLLENLNADWDGAIQLK